MECVLYIREFKARRGKWWFAYITPFGVEELGASKLCSACVCVCVCARARVCVHARMCVRERKTETYINWERRYLTRKLKTLSHSQTLQSGETSERNWNLRLVFEKPGESHQGNDHHGNNIPGTINRSYFPPEASKHISPVTSLTSQHKRSGRFGFSTALHSAREGKVMWCRIKTGFDV